MDRWQSGDLDKTVDQSTVLAACKLPGPVSKKISRLDGKL